MTVGTGASRLRNRRRLAATATLHSTETRRRIQEPPRAQAGSRGMMGGSYDRRCAARNTCFSARCWNGAGLMSRTSSVCARGPATRDRAARRRVATAAVSSSGSFRRACRRRKASHATAMPPATAPRRSRSRGRTPRGRRRSVAENRWAQRELHVRVIVLGVYLGSRADMRAPAPGRRRASTTLQRERVRVPDLRAEPGMRAIPGGRARP